MKMINSNSEIFKFLKNPIIAFILLIYVISLIITLIRFYYDNQSDLWGALGNVGDVFAPLIALLALCVMIIEIDDVRRLNTENDYRIKRREIRDDIFKLIEIHHDIVNRMRKANSDVNENGLRYFRKRYKEYKKQLEENIKLLLDVKNESKLYEYIESQFEIFFRDNHNQLGQYFRFVHNVLREIDDSLLTEGDKNKLVSLYVAQFSGWEYFFLFFNCICNLEESYKFSRLAIKYNLFQHMSFDEIKKCSSAIGDDCIMLEWSRCIAKCSYPKIIENKLLIIEEKVR